MNFRVGKSQASLSKKLDRLHRSSTVVDAHSDFALHVILQRLRGRKLGLGGEHLGKLRAGGVKVEVLTVGGDFFLDGVDLRDPRNVLRVFDFIHTELNQSPNDFGLVLRGSGLDDLRREGKIALLLALEGAAAIADDFSLIRNYYRLGLRSLILTHNERNPLADGCSETPGAGLSRLGKELIREATNLNMILDLVHLSEASFFDVLELTEKPPLVSHSNVRKLCDHPRNLTDRQIKAVAECEGVIGLNFIAFLVDKDIGKATLDRLLDHADYIVDKVGIEHVGLGPDFADYYMNVLESWLVQHNCAPELARYVEGVEDVSRLPKITERLCGRGYTDDQVRRILGENFVRVYKKVLA